MQIRAISESQSGLRRKTTQAGRFLIFILLGSLLLSAGCFRGRPSRKPPIHINPNMDKQERYRPQGQSNFFADRSMMRMPVPGTVARGDLREDDVLYRGIDARGDTVRHNPLPITMQLLQRGQDRFNIFCAPCHGAAGDGKGIVVARGLLPPPTFHSALMRNYPDGHFFQVISHGIRNMPAYNYQLPKVEDRWAIVAYIRALQRSQNATIDDLPEQIRAEYE